MKYLFLLLVLANVVLFVAWIRVPAPQVVQERPPESALTADVIVLEPVGEPRHETGREASPQVVGRDDRCLSLGPFYSPAAAEQARAWVERTGMSYLQTPGEETFKVGDWVYLPPLDSRDAATARAQELRELGIDDIYVVASDEFRNAIALGLYSTDRGVSQRLEYLQQLGVEAEVRERTRTREIISLYLWGEQPPGPEAVPDYIEEDGASLQEVDCQRIEQLHDQAGISYNSAA